jgi:hypothetical protein
VRKVNIILIILLLLGIITSCTVRDANNNTNPPEATPTVNDAPQENISEYFPLEVGNTWVYEGYGNEFAAYTQRVVYKKDNKYQTMSDNGGTVVANVIQVEKDRLINTYRVGESYEEKSFLDEPGNIYIELLKLPIEVGNSWVSEENIYEIVKIDETIVVPYGELGDCIVVRIMFKDGTEAYNYYKKGIGVVQSDFVISEAEVISSKLKEFTKK